MNHCINCPLRMFDKHYNHKGVGNPTYGNFIVIPNVDYDAYKKGMTYSKYVQIVQEVLSPFTGGLEDYYIVPLIRCRLVKECPVNDAVISHCINYTHRDIFKYNAVKIMLLGDAAKYFMNVDSISEITNKIYLLRDNVSIRGYSASYSPFVKYTDDNKYKEFCNHLIRWYNANKENNYNGYKIEMLR